MNKKGDKMIQFVGKHEGQNSQIRKENWPRKSGQKDHLGFFGCQEYLWAFIWWMRQKAVCPPFITSLLSTKENTRSML